MNTHILWDISNRKHWTISAKGSLEYCKKEMKELGEHGYEIHPNQIKESWDNPVTGIHYDCYMDNSTDSRPMTEAEIAESK